MRTKDEENEQRQRQQILNTAWQLFYQKGYQNTTMEDILRGARCSKGRFYYYFHAKAELLDSLYEIFDQKYIELYGLICREAHARDQLLEINRYMFQFLSNEIGAELLTSLYISQLSGTTGISFWGEERAVRRILSRSLLISWCLAKGEYDLTEASMPKLERFYRSYRED